jgi:hypothetical protein
MPKAIHSLNLYDTDDDEEAAYGIMYESKPTTRPSFMHKSI